MAKFFQRESLFKAKHVVHQVGDNELKFYPVSLNMLWELRTAFEPVVEALRILSAGKNDVERTVDKGKDEEGNERIVVHTGAVKPEIAQLREERTSKAWQKALDCLFSDDSRVLVGRLIADSLRDEFTREEAKDPEIGKKVIDSLDLAVLVEMVNGLLKANTRVFGPFAEKVRKAAEMRLNEALAVEDEARTDSGDEALDHDGELVEQSAPGESESSSPSSVS